MGEKSSEDGSFKVEDKRRFDAEGAERDNVTASEAYAASNDGTESSEWPPVTFSSFILSLATQTLMHLGELPPPPGVKLEVNLDAARQSIDLLMIMKEKTKGNLDTQEADLLEGVLHDAQMSFVRVSSRK